MQLELRLVNRDPCQDIAMRSNIQPLRNTLGWYPSPYVMGREQADGFIPLRSVLDPATGWLVDDTLTVKCKMTVSFSRIESIPFLVVRSQMLWLTLEHNSDLYLIQAV